MTPGSDSASRLPLLTERGILDCAKRLAESLPGVTPYFHTFRVHIVHHLERLVGVDDHISRMQPLRNVAAYPSLVESVLESLERCSLGDSFPARMQHWHELTRLAIISEPPSCDGILGRLRMPPGRTTEQQRAQIRAYAAEVAPLFRSAGLERIEAARRELCREAGLIEENKDILNLARLSLWRTDLDLRGRIGLAMHLRIMAEAIRRVAEDVFATELPEEDECGWGWAEAIRDFKKNVYGGHRILDDDSAARAFLERQGLDRSLKVRWYVEGATEFGFLDHVLGRIDRARIELVNLRGQVAQGSNNILTFRDNLRSDIALQIFSLVNIDNDRPDVDRAVRKAIADESFFGRVFRPALGGDFEFDNFELDELAEVLWRMAESNGAGEEVRTQLREAVQGAVNAGELMERASRAVPEYRFAKGADWGRELAVYFLEHYSKPDGSDRRVAEAVRYAWGIRQNQYAWTSAKYKVDPESGRMVERAPIPTVA